MKVYNKLVRDRIPEIIEASGKKVNYRVLSDDEFVQALKNKLLEEVNELLAAGTKEEYMEELFDVQDVLTTLKVYSLADYDSKYMAYIGAKKKSEKGSFYKKYFLESVEEGDE